jgi:competence protein ComEC
MSGEPLANGRREIYTLDVEQADAHAIITEDGTINLIDADKTKVGDELDTILNGRATPKTDTGYIPIETFAVTHIHDDHAKGVGTLHDHGYEIQHVVEPARDRYELRDPGTGKPQKGVKDVVMDTYVKGLKKHDPETIRQVAVGDSLSPDWAAQVVAPPSEPGTLRFTSPATGRENTLKPTGANANSLAFKTEGEQSVLFMGDVEDTGGLNGETRLLHQHDSDESDVDLNADILVLAHHGSDNATSEAFVERVDPEIAVISSDLGTKHDHPRDSVLKTLHEHDVDVYWTAGHGTIRTDLDQTLSPDPTTDLATTDAADLAALKYYCRENDVAPEEVETLAPGNLPHETPDWITTAAPLVAQTREEIADAAITNAETTEDVYQALKDHHPANRYLYLAIEDDRTEHVTTAATVRENQQRRDTAEQEQAAAQPSWRDRVQSALPLVPGPDLPEYSGPTPEEIEGPFKEAALPNAIRDSRTAKTMREDAFTDESPPDYLLDAEEQANNAVNNAENVADLCEILREHPGTHRDLMKAIETHDTRLPENLVSNEKATTQTISQDLSRDEGRGMSM